MTSVFLDNNRNMLIKLVSENLNKEITRNLFLEVIKMAKNEVL